MATGTIQISPAFEPVSRDLGTADNQSIERTYHIVAWEKTTWFHDLPMHAHIFVRPVSFSGEKSNAAPLRYPHHSYYYAVTATQLNKILHEQSRKAAERGEPFEPKKAHAEWKYVGINMTPPPVKVPNATRRMMQSERDIVCHMRSAKLMENYWPEARGGDYLFFVFKHVDTSLVQSFVVGINDVQPANNVLDSGKVLTSCVQVVAMRSETNSLDTRALLYAPGFEENDPQNPAEISGAGVKVHVGIMTRNRYLGKSERDDPKWTVHGVPCVDMVRANEQHADALIFAV